MTSVLAECARDFLPAIESGAAALPEPFHDLDSKFIYSSKMNVPRGPEHPRAAHSRVTYHQLCTELIPASTRGEKVLVQW